MKTESDRTIELAKQIQAREFLESKGWIRTPCNYCNDMAKLWATTAFHAGEQDINGKLL